ncbi:hypothetical protein [Microbulbifer epialgicus]|uniref:Uncharacterized protein n=1 Tax=Microbulbifer epialgicus TaxID=393907 RepID=A0ABV4P5P4_9GAMM
MFGMSWVKCCALLFWVIPSMLLFYVINLAANDSYFAFVAVIFGCNLVYDVTKKIVTSPINDFDSWSKIGARYGLGVLYFIVSIVGLYAEAKVSAPTYVLAVLISIPAYLASIYYFTMAEDAFKRGVMPASSN